MTTTRIPSYLILQAQMIACTRGTHAAAAFLRNQGIALAAARRILLLPARKVLS